MTNWQPDLGPQRRPLYRAIADALASDIRAGRLPVGTRLPTHRDLAWDLKVTVGTVTRAYAEAERRGLISGEVGRGTFVRPAGTAGTIAAMTEPPTPDFVDLSVNRPQTSGEAALLAKGLREIAGSDDLEALLQYQPHAGRLVDRSAGARWIARGGVDTDASHVLVTQSGQNAVASVLSAVTQPGDTVACESLTYPGVRSAASLLNLRLAPVAMDAEGLIPDSFAALCRSGSVKALYALPTLHNPTATVLSMERRQAVVEIARTHGVALIEDDVYGFMLDEAPAPFARLLPELSFYITSTSKSMAPGIRIGYVHAPGSTLDRVAAALRVEIAERQSLAREILGAARMTGNPAAPHLLLWMPEGWSADTFESAARRQGVGVTPATAFWLGRNAPPNAVRLCLGTPPKRADLTRALQRIAALLSREPQSYLSVI
jgi:DNA-binding transcriptional MocR family regulator